MAPRVRSKEEQLEIGKKLKGFRLAAGKTQKEMERALDVRQSVISNWENGSLQSWVDYRSELSDFLTIDRTTLDELAAGGPLDEPLRPSKARGEVREGELVEVPEYDVRLSAGGGFIVDRETTRRFWTLPRWLIVDSLGLRPDQITIQEVVGDSMSPTLETGDYVLIDLTDKRVSLPGIFAIWDGDALVCKRLERVFGSEPAEIKLISDNARHTPYQALAERVKVVGRVRWFTRKM